MLGFIRHTDDCSEILERIEVSHAGSLVAAEEGTAWTEVPLPVGDWTVILNGDGEPEAAPFVRSAPAALALAKQRRLAEVNSLLELKFATGFLVSETGTDLDGERLQVRNSEDRTNWLASESAYKDAIAAGAGAVVGAKFRSATNLTFDLSFANGAAVLAGMRTWAFALMTTSWALKDEINASSDPDAVDIEAGWP